MKTMCLKMALVAIMAVVIVGCSTYKSEMADYGDIPNMVVKEAVNQDAQQNQPRLVTALGTTSKSPYIVGKPKGESLAIDSPAMETAVNRVVIYSAGLRLTVPKVRDAIDKTQEIAGQLSGYMQEMSANSITVRVPTAKFDEAIAAFAKLGELTAKEIKGVDVTDEMRDLEIRLKNAEGVRDRLAKLLDKADKMEDALKIERELERVTETIELLKGKLQAMKHNAAYSTIRLEFNVIPPAQARTINTPLNFPWVEALSLDHIWDYNAYYRGKGDCGWFKMEIPEGFVMITNPGPNHGLRLVSAEDIIMAASAKQNLQGGNLEFWQKLIRKTMVERRAYAFVAEEKFQTKRKADGVILQFTAEQEPGRLYRYDVALFVDGSRVYVIEITGPEDAVKKDYEKIKTALLNSRM